MTIQDPNVPQGLDPTAFYLAKAIKKQESGGDYNKYGDAGTSLGAYQWNNGKAPLTAGQTPANFKTAAAKYLGDPNAPMTEDNQNKVAYSQIKEDLDSGLTQSQIAAKWNSGLTHGWENHVGDVTINGKTVHYDTPAYVNAVKANYLSYAQGGTPNTQEQPNLPAGTPQTVKFSPTYPQTPQRATGNNPTPQSDTLGGKLGGRIQDANQAVSDYTSGKQGLASTALQTVGAVAGAGGDIVTSALENTPIVGGVVKSLEGLLGSGVQSFLGTDTGKSVLKSVGQFAQDHPELSKDIGAGINIVSAIPILKGLGVGVNIAKDAGASVLKNSMEKVVSDGLTGVVSTTKTGIKTLAKNPDAVKTLVQARALPEIIDGKYSTKEASQILGDNITHIDETELQPLLEQISAKQNFGQSLTTLKNLAIKEAENDTSLREGGVVPKAIKQIEDRFAGWEHSYGDTVKLDVQNRLKIGSGKFSEWGTPEGTADKAIYRALQKNIEDVAKNNGMGDVGAINARMAQLIKAQDILPHIDGKRVKTGAIGSLLQTGATVGGGVAGGAVGLPPDVAAYVGNKGGGLVGKKLTGIPLSVLKRTGNGAERTSLKEGYKGTKGLVGGLIGQKVANPK